MIEILHRAMEEDKINRKSSQPSAVNDKPASVNSEKKSGLICMASIEPQDVEWLWQPYIPLGKITLMRGDPGQGKTTISLTLASIVSNGWAFPTESGFIDTPAGNVLYITAEDGLADTIAPRLIKAKANMDRIFSYEETASEQLSFMHPKFEELIKEAQPRLVIVDPIQGYLGSSVDGHKANEVRPVMSRVKELAEKYNCSVVLIEHMTKNAPGVKGLYRGLGSIDITAAARSIIMVGSNPDDERDKGIAHIKHNLSKPGKVVGFSISDERGLEWNPNTILTKEMIQGYGGSHGGDRGENKLETAKNFLQDSLKNGKQTKADIMVEADTAGIKEETLNRARRALRIESTYEGYGKGKTTYWALRQSSKSEDKIIPLFDNDNDDENPFLKNDDE